VDGGYGTYQYLNWANKFFIDSNLLEETLRAQGSGPSGEVAENPQAGAPR